MYLMLIMSKPFMFLIERFCRTHKLTQAHLKAPLLDITPPRNYHEGLRFISLIYRQQTAWRNYEESRSGPQTDKQTSYYEIFVEVYIKCYKLWKLDIVTLTKRDISNTTIFDGVKSDKKKNTMQVLVMQISIKQISRAFSAKTSIHLTIAQKCQIQINVRRNNFCFNWLSTYHI